MGRRPETEPGGSVSKPKSAEFFRVQSLRPKFLLAASDEENGANKRLPSDRDAESLPNFQAIPPSAVSVVFALRSNLSSHDRPPPAPRLREPQRQEIPPGSEQSEIDLAAFASDHSLGAPPQFRQCHRD